jgi:hypothetical protein
MLASRPLRPLEIPDNLDLNEFTQRYDAFVRIADIPALSYTNVFSGPALASAAHDSSSVVSYDESEDGSNFDYGPPVLWPGQGTRNCEEPNFLSADPREDAYYLQFGDLRPINCGVDMEDGRCWVSHCGSTIPASVVETYHLTCAINNSSSGKTRRPQKMILYYALADRSGSDMGYVSSGRVVTRYDGWRLSANGTCDEGLGE